MVRRQKGLIALGAAAGAQRCRYFCCGHHHAASILSDVDGELLVNGSWIGTDAFAYNAVLGLQGAGPMDSRRQCEARDHLANERQAAARTREARAATLPDRRRPGCRAAAFLILETTMPVHRTTKNGTPAYQWGDHGAKYAYTPGNKTSAETAKKRAIAQGLAVARRTHTKPEL